MNVTGGGGAERHRVVLTDEEVEEARRLQIPCLSNRTRESYAGYERKWISFLSARSLERDPFLRELPLESQLDVVTLWLKELRLTGLHGAAIAALHFYFIKNRERDDVFRLEGLGAARENLKPTDRETHE